MSSKSMPLVMPGVKKAGGGMPSIGGVAKKRKADVTVSAGVGNGNSGVSSQPKRSKPMPSGVNKARAYGGGGAAAAATGGGGSGGGASASSAVVLPEAKTKAYRPKSAITPRIENVVATAHLGKTLVLKDVAMKAQNVEYKPSKFNALIIRVRQPNTTALVFASGKMVIMGAKSEGDAKHASIRFADIVRKTGEKINLGNTFTIHNVVGCVDVKFRINLERLYVEHREFGCSYEPETFPGLTYRMKTPFDIVILVFHSGKVVLTKGKTRNEVYQAFDRFYPVLTKYEDKSVLSAAAGKTSKHN
eukprot:UC1_evm1s2103